MPNKNQKNKPNGFVIYANEIREELRSEGHIIGSMADLIAAASHKWQSLPADEREYYKERAKWEWENSKMKKSNDGQHMKEPVRPNRKDCTGSYVEGRVDFVLLNEERRKRERTEVFLSWPPGKAVTERSFYFLSFICLLEEPFFQPIEVAAVEFSLLGGVVRSWHRHINPGPIEVGYQYLAQQISESTHLIPVEGIAEPGETYTSIYDQLLLFLSRGTNHIPPIHVKMSDCEKVEGCIKWLARMAGRPHQLKRIYELEGLILDLDFHLKAQPQDFFQSKQIGTELISSTIFDWDSGSKCEYHQENETKFCAKGYVNKYSYLISEYFCTAHGITATEQHVPIRDTDDKYYTLINNNPKERSRRKNNSVKSREEIEREGIARKVAEHLSLLKVEENGGCENDEEDKRKMDEKTRLEQKKRWLALRGVSVDQTTDDEDCKNSKSSPVGMKSDQLRRPVFGRGRGMVGTNVVYSLRKPIDQSGHVSGTNEKTNFLPLGRGTKMYKGN